MNKEGARPHSPEFVRKPTDHGNGAINEEQAHIAQAIQNPLQDVPNIGRGNVPKDEANIINQPGKGISLESVIDRGNRDVDSRVLNMNRTVGGCTNVINEDKPTANLKDLNTNMSQAQNFYLSALDKNSANPNQKHLLTPIQNSRKPLLYLEQESFHFSNEVVQRPRNCYDLPMLQPVINYIEHLKAPNSGIAKNTDLAKVLDFLVSACKECASQLAANADVMQDIFYENKNSTEDMLENLDVRMAERKKSTDDHLDIMENKECFNARNIIRHEREINGIYKRLDMSDEEIKKWKDKFKSDDLEEHQLVDILYNLDINEGFNDKINESLFEKIIHLENSMKSTAKDYRELNDQVKRIDQNFYDSIEEVKANVNNTSTDCPGAKIISKIDNLQATTKQVETKQVAIVNDLITMNQRLINVENKKIDQKDMPKEVSDSVQGIIDELANTKKANTLLTEKINVLEATQGSMSQALSQIMGMLNLQGFNTNNSNEGGVNYGQQANFHTPASNLMQLENVNHNMVSQPNSAEFNQMTNIGTSNVLPMANNLGNTAQQQKLIHGFMYGKESVANWDKSGNDGGNYGTSANIKVSHGLGGNKNQLDMSINSDN